MATFPQPVAVSQGQSNPVLNNAMSVLSGMASQAKQFAQAYPQCADEMQQISDLLRQCLLKTTQAQQPSEPAAPPV